MGCGCEGGCLCLAQQADRKQEAAYFANCQAVLHEHIRLQSYIKRSLPRLLRRIITRHLLTYQVGAVPLSVAEDLPVFDDVTAVSTWSAMKMRAETDTRVADWSDMQQRMDYIADLFRVMHRHPAVFSAPYTDRQMAAVAAGRRPAGVL